MKLGLSTHQWYSFVNGFINKLFFFLHLFSYFLLSYLLISWRGLLEINKICDENSIFIRESKTLIAHECNALCLYIQGLLWLCVCLSGVSCVALCGDKEKRKFNPSLINHQLKIYMYIKSKITIHRSLIYRDAFVAARAETSLSSSNPLTHSFN